MSSGTKERVELREGQEVWVRAEINLIEEGDDWIEVSLDSATGHQLLSFKPTDVRAALAAVERDDSDHWYQEARYLEGKLKQAYDAYEIVAAERDGYRNLLHKFAEVQAEATLLKPQTIVLERAAVEREGAGREAAIRLEEARWWEKHVMSCEHDNAEQVTNCSICKRFAALERTAQSPIAPAPVRED